MAVMTLYKEFKDCDVVIGYVCQFPSGEYWFNPRRSGRRSSIKRYKTPEACIPRWAMKEADRIERA